VGALLPKLKQSLGALSGSQLMEEMTRNGKILISIDGKEIELDGEDIQVRLSAKDGWAAAQGSSCVVALNTALTPSLIREGIVKDAIRLVQDLRKRRQCNFTDRIVLTVYCESQQILDALQEHRDFLTSETLASSLHLQLGSGDTTCELVELADEKVAIDLKIVPEA
jgi:isoleucyl-tRNA synthetase